MLYVSDKCGSDQDGDGTQQKPFKTPLRALQFAGKEPFPVLYVDSQKEDERWAVISKTQMKNAKKAFNREQMKSDSKDKKEAEDGERREKNLEEAKKIVIQNDPSLPEGGCCVPSGGVHKNLPGPTLKLVLSNPTFTATVTIGTH
uniref:Asparaginyl-tRNA synthetase 1 n=1 Tax=Salarias fasciatus TaxID=181472 RepID=A0A672G8T5_SALFA